MDVGISFLRPLSLALVLAVSSPLAFAADEEAKETPLQLQQRRLDALRGVAESVSPSNPPGRDELRKGMIVVMAIADPALLPARWSKPAALKDLRAVCANSAQALPLLAQMAWAEGDGAALLSQMSVAVDRTMIMGTACATRELTIQANAALARPGKKLTAEERESMQKIVASMPANIAGIVLGASLIDLDPKHRERTALDGLPVLLEAVWAMPPAGKAATNEAVEKLLGPPERDGHIDHAARNALMDVLRLNECEASCKLLGGS